MCSFYEKTQREPSPLCQNRPRCVTVVSAEDHRFVFIDQDLMLDMFLDGM